MAKVKSLTDILIRNLKPRAGERPEVFEGHGFGVRVESTGRKTFNYLYRMKGDGKKRRLILGVYAGNEEDKAKAPDKTPDGYPLLTLAEARKAHAEAIDKVRKGIDPGTQAIAEREADRQAKTVADLSDEYLEKWAKPRKRSWKEDERILIKDILPEWGQRKACEITRRDVINLLDDIVDRGAKIMANRTLAVVRKMFNFAVSRDIVPVSPCLGIQAPAQEQQRDRVLTTDEICALWHALDGAKMAEGTKIALKLQLVTAQRKAEIVSAAWDEIDLNGKWWTIPAEKAKNKMAHRVPLSPLALELLQQAKALSSDSHWVLPSPRAGKHITPEAVDHALRRPGLESLGFTFVPHDLRRTAASHMTGAGVSRLVVSKLLNHVENGVTAVYDRHSYDREKRQALETWSRKLGEIIGGQKPKSNVVHLIGKI
jgi:integrase